jgi:uncharacterized membrane protein YraQ (UPF0718 family)
VLNPDNVKDIIINFTSIFYEALPFIILGSIISGVLEHIVPQAWTTKFIPKNRILAIALGCLLGLVFPMCECGIVPVMRRLLRKGVPLSCCVAYMMAGPVINVVVIASTIVAFTAYDGGWYVVGLRIGQAFVVAFVTALIVDWQYRQHGVELLVPAARPVDQNDNDNAALAGRKLAMITETALHDFVDITVFLTLGAALASVTRLFFTPDDVANFAVARPVAAILVMMLLAFVLCLCSEADAFVAASFSTLPPAPKLAFLVLGPMLDIKLLVLFTRVYRARLIWIIVASVIIQTFVYNLIVHFTVPPWVGSAIPRGTGN